MWVVNVPWNATTTYAFPTHRADTLDKYMQFPGSEEIVHKDVSGFFDHLTQSVRLARRFRRCSTECGRLESADVRIGTERMPHTLQYASQ